MKPRYYLDNPRALLCFALGHTPDPSTEHSLCSSDKTLMYCKRCVYLYKIDEGDDNE